MKNIKTFNPSVSQCGVACNPKTSSHQLVNESFFSQVKNFCADLFNTQDWPARWHCGKWSEFHGWLYILSDAAIWIAYFAIPILLLRIIRKEPTSRFQESCGYLSVLFCCAVQHIY